MFDFREAYDRLFAEYGPQHWWPGETPTEIVVGAILTQNTAWANVERAIANLKAADCLTWATLRDISSPRLADLIRPAGTFRVKTKRLKAFVGQLWTKHAGSLDVMLTGDLDAVRTRLLAINGIGPETADAILLYAGERPTFVVDAYTNRLLRRHFVIEDVQDYEAVQKMFHAALPRDSRLFNEYHALLVQVGKRHCRARATCEECPLVNWPHDATR